MFSFELGGGENGQRIGEQGNRESGGRSNVEPR